MTRYPSVEPYDQGMLDLGDGHHLYWECSGNPSGEPALFLHGGPGSGCGSGARRFFDPKRFRIVLFDQRGCGRSEPLACGPQVDLSTNNTSQLVADIETLRSFLKVEQWTILGISWGTTLALAYAQAFPARVHAMVLALLSLTSREDVSWMTTGMAEQLPRSWARFQALIPISLEHLSPVEAYAEMLLGPDLALQQRAATEWCRWDVAQMAGREDANWPRGFEDPRYRLRFARLVTHYWRHGGFLAPDQLFEQAWRMEHIKGTIVHGRNDPSCPLRIAERLAAYWPQCELRVLDMGHGDDDQFPLVVTSALDQTAPRACVGPLMQEI